MLAHPAALAPALQLMAGSRPAPSDESKTPEIRAKTAVARSATLRAGAGFITDAGFRQRRAFFLSKVRRGGLMAA